MDVLSAFVALCKNTSFVQGVVLTGSWSRGDNDLFSDIDLVVVLDKVVDFFPEGKSVFEIAQLDIRYVSLADLEHVSWSMAMFFAYLRGSVVFDRFDRVSDLIDLKRREWEDACFTFICLLFASIGFIFPLDSSWRGLGGMTHFDRFLKRGDLLSAQRLLQRTHESFFEMTYLLNREPYPDYKNIVRCLRGISWVPRGLVEYEYDSLKFSHFSEEGLLARKKMLDVIYKEIRLKAEEEFLLPKDLYSYHLEHRYVA